MATTDAAGTGESGDLRQTPVSGEGRRRALVRSSWRNRLTHDNVEHNPSASYLFIEEGEEFAGKRLSLIVGEEEFDPEKIKAIRRRNDLPISDEECKFLVHFHIEGVRPLIGNG